MSTNNRFERPPWVMITPNPIPTPGERKPLFDTDHMPVVHIYEKDNVQPTECLRGPRCKVCSTEVMYQEAFGKPDRCPCGEPYTP